MRLLFMFLLTSVTLSAKSQPAEEKAIRTTIDRFFTGMRSGDTVMVAGTFSPTAVLQTIVQKKDGSVEVRTEQVDEFISSIGKPHKEIYDEQIQYGNILIEANLASVWTPYKFYLGKTFSHCGVNSFQLVKINNEWKLQYIIDTRRKEPCEMK